MKTLKLITTIVILIFTFSCNQLEKTNKENSTTGLYKLQQTIYHGGDIITMAGDIPNYVDAVVQREGKIVFTGSKEEAIARFGGKALEVNLEGKTMVPGFIDGHGHVFNVGLQALSANMLPAPDGEGNTVSDLQRLLRDWILKNKDFIEKTGWVIGFGYDDSQLDRYPTKEDLDAVTTDYPVIIIHQSGHLNVLNSKGLEIAGYTAETKDPKGGKIRRVPGSQEPNGILEEIAHFTVLIRDFLPKVTTELQDNMLLKGQNLYASFGYTTAQEGRTTPDGTAALERASESDALILDVVSYPDILSNRKAATSKYHGNNYYNGYRIGGVKLNLDGSPQGKTAWLTHAYHIPPDGEDKDYHGYSSMSDEDAYKHVADAYQNNWQLMSHCNGDAAIDQYVKAISKANKEFGNDDRRIVIIHAQTAREDQVKSFVEQDIFPSFFPMHTFYWGDWHKEIIGDSLGNKISPTRTALNKGLKITIHTDAPVALPNLMRVIWTATNRVSRSGKIIGEKERLTPYEALKCITEWSAYQHFEEDRKGTIEVGKLADLVILNENPLKSELDDIKDILVMETIKEGVNVYKKEEF